MSKGMQLILWRHAEAEDAGTDMDDLGRALTPRGREQAKKMAGWLRGTLPKGTRILVSPAERARQTADALDLPYDVEARISPGAEASALLQASNWPKEEDSTVLIVGHQPTLGRLAARLLAGQEMYWSVKKAAIWWLHRRERFGSVEVVLRHMRTASE